LKEAVTLDTGFASALWQYSKMMELGGSATASEHQALLARAWNHRERLTEYEQLRVEIAYRFSPDGVTPDMDAHRERLRQVVERYPNAIDAATLATFYLAEHDLPAAKRAFHRVIELDSTRLEGYAGLVGTLLWANQVRDARRVVDEIARRFPAALDVDVADVLVSYAERRLDHEREIVRRLKATAGPGRPLGYYVEANLELLAGHVEASERLLAERNALSPPSRFPLLPIPELGVSYWVRNRPELSLPMLNEFVARDTARHLGLDFAQSFAQFGLVDAAKALLAANGFPRRTIYSRGTDTLQTSAWIDFAQGRPREAAQKFRGSLRFSGGAAPSQSRLDAEIGLAFERAQLPDSAIAVYEHFLNAPASLEGDAIHLVPVLEHVAPLYEKRGDRRKARDAYARIAELWKTADPELQPRVAHARERAAALR
jgi:tetratricopeptide (TPR) repeat protein